MASFLSDNVSGAHPKVVEALLAANDDDHRPYGDDHWSRRLDEAFTELFGRSVAVVPCMTGTAANALALSLLAGPIDSIAAHAGSHVYNDECNGPEFFSGSRLIPIQGPDGKLTPQDLATFPVAKGDRHRPQPAAISLAQATETGSVYSRDGLMAIGDFAKAHGLRIHQDGARFANAVAALDLRPSDLTWKAGVDVLSFGATKNGCIMAEAVVLFDPALASEARYRAKRAGQLASKMRFVSAQLLAYIADGLWLANARHANAMARGLAETLAAHPAVQVAKPPQANMVFATMPSELIVRLESAGLAGYHSHGTMRLCTSWKTQAADLERIAQALQI